MGIEIFLQGTYRDDCKMMGAFSPELLGHSVRVGNMMRRIVAVLQKAPKVVVDMNLPSEEDAFLYGVYHDIGKLFIPANILNKPGALTREEYRIIQKHTECGRQAIQQLHTVVFRNEYQKEMAIDTAHSHHEAWDGSGYPCNLSGKQIPLIACICAIADVFDALTSKRVYKKSWPREKALAYIEERSGKQFDPCLACVLLRDTSWAIISDHEQGNPHSLLAI